MIDLLFRLSDLGIPVSAIAAEVSDRQTMSGNIGFVVLAIIVGPVVILTIASMLEHPRTFRIPTLFIGSVILLISAIISSFAAAGMLLKLVIPQ
ncbi:MAG: hypothetical protein HY529_04030 [Chloroflexi bacterium]|nr:hypothetical protein [Chloroflexota bacterium]